MEECAVVDTLECDVLIVGARVAGSVLATTLGAAGHDVILVDRARFPSPTVSTHFFRGARGVEAFRQIDVLDEILALGAPPLVCQYHHLGAAEPLLDAAQDPGDVGFCLSVRREPLDDILLRRAAREPTVRVLQETRVGNLIWDGERVTGAVVTHAGRQVRVGARFVVGADGRHSSIARQVDAPYERKDAPTRALFYRYVRDFASPAAGYGPEFSPRGDEMVYVFPSDAGVACVAASINLAVFDEIRYTLNTSFDDVVARHPGVADRYARATPLDKVQGCGPEQAYVRKPVGAGWALVGDASLHQDPWTGRGIDFASTHARALAGALAGALSGEDEAAALQGYWDQRNEDLDLYKLTTELAKDLTRLTAD